MEHRHHARHRGLQACAAIALIGLALWAGCGGQSGKQESAPSHAADGEQTPAKPPEEPSFGRSTETEAADTVRVEAAAQQTPAGQTTRAQPGEQSPQRIRPNRPPVARFEVKPIAGYAAMTEFTFDASFTTDDINMTGEMQNRWDYDGDGTWDTQFTRATRMSHAYEKTGVYRPRLEVRDGGGLTSAVTGSEVTVRENCPGPDFALADMNPNSTTFGKEYRLSELRGRRVVLWLASPTH